MTYSAVSIANYFIQLGLLEKRPITPMKLQKLVYISHGWFLALSGGEALIKEKVGAWPFGPVIATLYKRFSKFSKMPIDEIAKDIDGDVLSEDVKEFLDKIWSVYGGLSASQLSNLTHQNGTPWDQVYQEGATNVIPNDVIRKHFEVLGK